MKKTLPIALALFLISLLPCYPAFAADKKPRQKVVTATIADLSDSATKFEGKSFLVNGYAKSFNGDSATGGLFGLCEGRRPNPGICLEVGAESGPFAEFPIPKETLRRLIRSSASMKEEAVTIVGFFVGNTVYAKEIKFDE